SVFVPCREMTEVMISGTQMEDMRLSPSKDCLPFQLEHPHTVPADGAVGVKVEGHQAFWTCDNQPFISVLTTVPPHTDSWTIRDDSSSAAAQCSVGHPLVLHQWAQDAAAQDAAAQDAAAQDAAAQYAAPQDAAPQDAAPQDAAVLDGFGWWTIPSPVVTLRCPAALLCLIHSHQHHHHNYTVSRPSLTVRGLVLVAGCGLGVVAVYLGLSFGFGGCAGLIFPDPSDFERCCKLKDRLPSIVVEPTDGEVESGELRWPPEEFIVSEEEEDEDEEEESNGKAQTGQVQNSQH
ncbi:hypothetical protein NFI96_018259, partial [Prochilodus magdalenae]